ncbi:MAG TPA: hypothetical protein VFF16_01445, partial [Telluria sp.]|nr:hypothetical protein [Telluria sp.]
NFNYRYDLLAHETSEAQPAALMHDAIGAGVVFARSDWTLNASWMDFIAGTFDQSHAHEDQGSFTLYRHGWLAVSPNIFSHSGLHEEVTAHSVLRFDQNGAAIPQNHGTATRTVNDGGDILTIAANLTPIYADHAQAVPSWNRTMTYARSSHTFTVHDTCQVAADVHPVWQLQLPTAPQLQSDGSIVAGGLVIRPLLPAAPSVNVVDLHASGPLHDPSDPNSIPEFDAGYRLELSAPSGCEFKVELKAL